MRRGHTFAEVMYWMTDTLDDIEVLASIPLVEADGTNAEGTEDKLMPYLFLLLFLATKASIFSLPLLLLKSF